MNNSHLSITILWIARISSLGSIAFLLFMVGGHLFGSEPSSGTPTFGEMIALSFFPLGVIIGLITAWKWDGLGGMIAVGSIIGFHLTMFMLHEKPSFDPLIDALAAPGLLFLLSWFLSSRSDAHLTPQSSG